jgi:hypothetical protein
MDIMPFKVGYLDFWNGFLDGLLGHKKWSLPPGFPWLRLVTPKRIISRSGSAKENYEEMKRNTTFIDNRPQDL